MEHTGAARAARHPWKEAWGKVQMLCKFLRRLTQRQVVPKIHWFFAKAHRRETGPALQAD